MIEFLIYTLASYFVLGMFAWLYLGYKDGFIEESTPAVLGVIKNLEFVLGWYIILIEIAAQKMESADPKPQDFEENLEEALDEIAGE